MANRRDCWAEWLAERRFGGDATVRREFLAGLEQTRETVLDNAKLVDGERLLDVGCGEGLIGFGALARGAATVVFSDISEDLLATCRRHAEELGVLERCAFVQARADDLAPIPRDSVDVVTTRSVLIYVEDKAAAFSEFFRVLGPRGRISLFEPINRFSRRNPTSFGGYALDAVPTVAQKLRAHYDAVQPPDSDPMLNFDERDLVEYAEQAGFFPIELDLHVEIVPTQPRRWETFLEQSGNPKIPSLGEAMERALTPAERQQLAAHLRPLVEAGGGVWRLASAYLYASKPDAGGATG